MAVAGASGTQPAPVRVFLFPGCSGQWEVGGLGLRLYQHPSFSLHPLPPGRLLVFSTCPGAASVPMRPGQKPELLRVGDKGGKMAEGTERVQVQVEGAYLAPQPWQGAPPACAS